MKCQRKFRDGLLIFLSFIFSDRTAWSENGHYCSEWTQQRGIVCIFAGRNAKFYRRQCENPCGYNYSHYCDREELCYLENPDFFNGGCSPWVRVRGIVCYNPNTEEWEDKWERACTIWVRQEWCSDKDPNRFNYVIDAMKKDN